MTFSLDQVKLADPSAEISRIVAWLAETVRGTLRRRGAVLGLSGGIDSSVVAALCVRAFGKDGVLGLFMNEGESADDTVRLARVLSDHLGIATATEDISGMLDAAGCYRRRDDAIRTVVPGYRADWKCKLVLPSVLESDRYRIYSIVVRSPEGEQTTARLSPAAYLEIVAATNFKQRCRKMLEYFHADRLVYAVAGTPNLLEYDQGFFVKGGDGAADLKPIAHLYKTQVYALARHLGLPEEICDAQPTTDTYSLPQGQDEFYFALPYDRMDLALWAHNHAVPASELAVALNMSEQQAGFVYADIEAKRRATRYLHTGALLVEPVAEITSP